MATPSPGVAVGKAAMVLLVLAAVAAGALFVLRDGRAPGLATAAAPTPAVQVPEPVAPSRADLERDPRRRAEAPAPAAPGVAPDPQPARRDAATIVRGRVVDARGAAVAGADVLSVGSLDVRADAVPPGMPRELRETRQGHVRTTEAGEFAIRLPRSGPFELVASFPGHPPTRHRGDAPAAGLTDLVLVLRDGLSITGHVVGVPPGTGELNVVARRLERDPAAAGSALEDHVPESQSQRASVAADGSFGFTGLDPDAHFRMEAVGRERRCSERIDVAAGARGIELHWRGAPRVVVRVVDADSGAPLECLDVAIGPVRGPAVPGSTRGVPDLAPVQRLQFPGGFVETESPVLPDEKDTRLGLEIHADGHAVWTRDDIDVSGSDPVDLGTARLAPAPIVRVRVTGAAGPVAGVAVRLEFTNGGANGARPGSRSTVLMTDLAPGAAPPPPRRTVTDASGVLELPAETSGEACLVATSPDHAEARSEPFAVPSRGVVERSLWLARGGTVVVHAVDGHGVALAGEDVVRRGADRRDEQTLRTDANGKVAFSHLAPGPHRFRFSAARSGGVVIRGSRERPPAPDEARIELADGAEVDVRLQAPLLGDLTGTITLDGHPLVGASVSAIVVDGDTIDSATWRTLARISGWLSGAANRTDIAGSYSLRAVRTGTQCLRVAHPDLAMPTLAPVPIAEGDNHCDLALVTTIVRGRVLDELGAPLPGASVSATVAPLDPADGADPGPRGVRADATGAFELRGVIPDLPLRVAANGADRVEDHVLVEPLTAGEVRGGLEFRLAPAGRLLVRAPVGTSVRAEWAGGEPRPKGAAGARTAALLGGKATFEGLTPGRWKVIVPSTGEAGRERSVDVKAGELLTVDL